MPNRWFLAADPEDYGMEELLRDRAAPWDGVHGTAAQANMRKMKPGDPVLVYEGGKRKAVAGAAKIVHGPYPDPTDPAGKRVLVDVGGAKRFKRALPLAELRGTKGLEEMKFLKMARVSVSAVTDAEWAIIAKMGDGK